MPRKFTPEYPLEFRSEAVRLVRDGGRSISAAAKDLGVSAESLRHWVKQDALDSGRLIRGPPRTRAYACRRKRLHPLGSRRWQRTRQ